MTHRLITLLAGGALAATLSLGPALAKNEMTVLPEELFNELQASDAIDLDTVYLRDGVDLGSYEQVYLEPVLFAVDEKELRLTTGDENQLSRSLERAITRAPAR